tara:strand:+ start:79008 stop:79331 length:324 start_codon:yes stop_codon:yes gene_type:complete
MINNTGTFNYYDMNSIKEFKGKVGNDVNGNSKEDLEVVASQLESVFLKMVLKSMREAQESLKSDLFSSNSNDMYQDMHDNQLSLSLSKMKSIGLQDVIMRQLDGSQK